MGLRGLSLLGIAAVISAGISVVTTAQAQGPAPQGTPAPAGGAVHIVTYLDLTSAGAVQAASLLKRYRDAARKQSANLNVDVYQEIGRIGRFAIREGWRDARAFEDNAAAEHAKQLSAALKPLQLAPADQRRHDAYSMGNGRAVAGTAAVYVLTHVDVPPPLLAELEPQLKLWAEGSRKDAGVIAFDVLQQANRKNHFTVVEGWQSSKAFEAQGAAGPARTFRDKLGPMLGALYDQRLYRLVKS